MAEINEIFSNNFQKFMERRGLTQTDVAEKMEVSNATRLSNNGYRLHKCLELMIMPNDIVFNSKKRPPKWRPFFCPDLVRIRNGSACQALTQ